MGYGSLRRHMTLIILGMGLLGVILALSGSQIYRQLILADQQQAFSRLIALKADDLLQQLYHQVTELGASLQSNPALQTAFKQKNTLELQQALDAQFKQIFVTANIITIQKMMIYDADFQLVSQSSNPPHTLEICPQFMTQLQQRISYARLKPTSALCHWNHQPTFAVVVPIGSVRILGYLLLAVDPLPYLKKIEPVLGMPLDIQDVSQQVLYTSAHRNPTAHYLTSGHSLFGVNQQPVLTLTVWNEVSQLNEQLQHARYWILGVALCCTFIVMAGVWVLLNRQLLLPLSTLLKHLRKIEADDQYLGEPLTIGGYSEIQTLATGFNKMSATLKQTYESLQQQHDHLDDLVRERTLELLILRDQALQANQAKSRFIANISHEFRTPLNALLGYSEIIQEEAKERGHVCYLDDLSRLREASQRLLGLVNDALAVARIETGKIELNLSNIELEPLVADLLNSLQPRLHKQHNQIQVHYEGQQRELYADAEKLKQILFNLLDNANKFTHAGHITLTITPKTLGHEHWFEFQIADTGIGIETTQIDTLFELFTQADESSSRRYEGTGMGLALSQRFSHLMGGTITATSVLGQGSTFTVTLPAEVQPDCCFVCPPLTTSPQEALTNPEQIRFKEADKTQTLPERRQKLTTLLLLTTPADKTTPQFLTHQGFRVQTCFDPMDGLTIAKNLQPDVIIFESFPANSSGWSLFQGLKRDPKLATVPLIVLSALNQHQAVFTRGISGCLTKPVGNEYLSLMAQQFALNNNHEILLVESDRTLRQMMQRALEKSGWTLRQATHGQQALDLLQQHQPGLILLDLYLPQMDGFKFVQTLRQHKEWRKLPIVVISSNELTKSECMQLNGWTVMNTNQDPNPQQLQLLHDMVLSCVRGRTSE